MNQRGGGTAADLVNTLDADALTRILGDWGEIDTPWKVDAPSAQLFEDGRVGRMAETLLLRRVERSRSICLINILTATDEVMPSSSHSSANESLIDESTRTLSTDAAIDTSCMTLSIYYHTD